MAEGRSPCGWLQIELNRTAGESDQIKKARADDEAVMRRQGRTDEPRFARSGEYLLGRWSGPGIGWRQDQATGMQSDVV